LSGETRTYLIRAFDAPPDAPGATHETPYPPVKVASLSAHTALDRNALRPFGAPNEQKVLVQYVVTEPGRVTIKVYSLAGTFVKQLLDDDRVTGLYRDLYWDGTNMNGQLVASGVYLVTTKMSNRQEVAKIAVIK
jgi:hypothetical protein